MAKNQAAKTSGRPDPEKLSFEDAVEEIQAIIERIESGEIGLEEALAERRRGDALIKRCRAVLEVAEQELRQIDLAAEGDDATVDDESP